MQDKKRQQIFLLIILIVVGIFIWRPFSKFSRDNTVLLDIVNILEVSEPMRPKSAYVEWGRNPFLLSATQPSSEGLVLNGILWDQNSPKALIGERIVGIGDFLGSDKIIDIQSDRIILDNGSHRSELKLPSPEIENP